MERAGVSALPAWPFPAGRTRVSVHRFPIPPILAHGNGSNNNGSNNTLLEPLAADTGQPGQMSTVVPDQGGAVFFVFEEMADAVSLSWHRLG